METVEGPFYIEEYDTFVNIILDDVDGVGFVVFDDIPHKYCEEVVNRLHRAIHHWLMERGSKGWEL